MASKTLARTAEDLATVNRMVAALEYRSTPEERSAHFEDIYSSYTLLKAETDELRETKKKIHHELFQSNRDRIDELLFDTTESNTTDWGDWDTWEKVQKVVQKFAYGQSPNITTNPDVLEAMKKNLAIFGDVNKAQSERIQQLESCMAELQSEISGLMNLLQLKERKAQTLVGENRMLLLQVRQKQREVDELGGRNTDEKELVKDFKLAIDANKRLEKENLELRAKLNGKDGFLGIFLDGKEVKANAKESTSAQQSLSLFNRSNTSSTQDPQTEEQVGNILRNDERRLSYLFKETPISAIWTTLNRRMQVWMQYLEKEVDSAMNALDYDANSMPFCDESGGIHFDKWNDTFVLPSQGVFTVYRGYNDKNNALDELKAHLPVSVSYAPRDDIPFWTPPAVSGVLTPETAPDAPLSRTARSSKYNSFISPRVDQQVDRNVMKKKSKKKEGRVESSFSLSYRAADGRAPLEVPLKSKKNVRTNKERRTRSISPPTPVPNSFTGSIITGTNTEPVPTHRAWTSLSRGILAVAELSRAECLKREYLHISCLRKKLQLEQKHREAATAGETASITTTTAAEGICVTGPSGPSPNHASPSTPDDAPAALPRPMRSTTLPISSGVDMPNVKKIANPSRHQRLENPKQDEIPCYDKTTAPSSRESFRQHACQPIGAAPFSSVAPDTQLSELPLSAQVVTSPTSSHKVLFSESLTNAPFEQLPSSHARESVPNQRVCSEAARVPLVSEETLADAPSEHLPSSPADRSIVTQGSWKMPYRASRSPYNAFSHHSIVAIGCGLKDLENQQSLKELLSEGSIPRQMDRGSAQANLNFLQCLRSNSQAIHRDIVSLSQSFYQLCSATQESFNALQLAFRDVFHILEMENNNNVIASGEVETAFNTMSKSALKDLAKERIFSIMAEHGVQLEQKEITKGMSDLDWMMQQMRLVAVNAAESYLSPPREEQNNSFSYNSRGSAAKPCTLFPCTDQNAQKSTVDLSSGEVDCRHQKKAYQSLLHGPSNDPNAAYILEDAVANSYFVKDIMNSREAAYVPQWGDFVLEGKGQQGFSEQKHRATLRATNPGWHRRRRSSLTLEEYRSAGLFLKGHPQLKEAFWRPLAHDRFEAGRLSLGKKPPAEQPPYRSVPLNSGINILQLLKQLQLTKRQSIEQIQPLVYSYRLGTTVSNAQQRVRHNFALSVQNIFGNSFKEFVEKHILHVVTAAHSLANAAHVDHSFLTAIHHLRKEEEARRQQSVKLLLRRVATNIRTRMLARKFACIGNAFHLYMMILYDRWRAHHEKMRSAIHLDSVKKRKRLLNLVADCEGGSIGNTVKKSITFLPPISNMYSGALGPSSAHFQKVNLPDRHTAAKKR